jgi:hypothetical protein
MARLGHSTPTGRDALSAPRRGGTRSSPRRCPSWPAVSSPRPPNRKTVARVDGWTLAFGHSGSGKRTGASCVLPAGGPSPLSSGRARETQRTPRSARTDLAGFPTKWGGVVGDQPEVLQGVSRFLLDNWVAHAGEPNDGQALGGAWISCQLLGHPVSGPVWSTPSLPGDYSSSDFRRGSRPLRGRNSRIFPIDCPVPDESWIAVL